MNAFLFRAICLLMILGFPAQAAMKFQYRSTSASQSYYASGLRDMVRIASNTALSLTAGPAGTFGGSYLDMTGSPFVVFPGNDNAPVGTTALSVLFRIVPVASGNPASAQGLITIGNLSHFNNFAFGGLQIGINTSGQVHVLMGSPGSGINYVNLTFATAPTYTANTPLDIWFVWDGTTTAGHVELWTAANGNTASKISTGTASNALVAMIRGQVPEIAIYDGNNNAKLSFAHINEIAIFDTAVTPSSYGARTDFISASAYEGYNYTSLSADQVKTGVAYGPGPGTLTGTLTCTDPGIANVLSGTNYTIYSASLTGTYTAPACSDPGISNVLSGTNYTISGVSKTGTRDDALIATVLSGVTYAAGTKTGTLTIPSASAVAAAVWDEALSGHTTAGTTGKKLSDISTASAPSASTIASAVWEELLSGHTTSGSAGATLNSCSTKAQAAQIIGLGLIGM